MVRRAGVLLVSVLALAVVRVAAPTAAVAAPMLTVGANVNVTKTAGNQNEAGIAVDPTNPQHLFMAMNTDATAFPDGLLAAVSSDGGATWTTRHLADGVTDTLTQACCDPKVSWDRFGNLFLTYLNSTTSGVIVARSTDGGASFTQLTSIAASDQPSIATGANSVWVTFERGGTGIEAAGASVTGLGVTGAFSAPEVAPGSNGGNFGDIAIGPAGQVLVTYEEPDGGQGPATLFVNLDADGLGAGGFGAQITATATNVGGFDFIPAQPDRSVDAEGNLAWDRTGGPHNGRVYLAYTDETPNESNDTDILLRHSDDNGATWSAPVRVNDDATTRSQFNPDISLDPTTGNIGITFHDTRNDSGSGAGDTDGVPNTDAQRWGTVSTDGGSTFLPNVKISAGTSHQNNLPGPGFADIDFGDYDTSTFYSNQLYSAWSDNSNSTGDNPQGSLKQMDEYVARVTFGLIVPTIKTQASAPTLLGGPVHDAATLSGGASPTGTITFKAFGPNDGSCAGPVAFTSTVPVAGNGTYSSANFTPPAVGTYRWTADYSGDSGNATVSSPCNAADESVVVNPFAPPPCTLTLTGDVTGPVTVNSGDSVCVNNAKVVGPITVNPGGALTVTASKVTNGVTASAPAFLSICGTQISAPTATPSQGVVESGAAVPIRIGDPAAGCATNQVAGGVSLTSNTAGVTFGANTVSRDVTVDNNTVGNTVIKANHIFGTLACSGNNPPPTNAGQPNTAGAETGQCVGL